TKVDKVIKAKNTKILSKTTNTIQNKTEIANAFAFSPVLIISLILVIEVTIPTMAVINPIKGIKSEIIPSVKDMIDLLFSKDDWDMIHFLLNFKVIWLFSKNRLSQATWTNIYNLSTSISLLTSFNNRIKI